jgi:hypothetical protein
MSKCLFYQMPQILMNFKNLLCIIVLIFCLPCKTLPYLAISSSYSFIILFFILFFDKLKININSLANIIKSKLIYVIDLFFLNFIFTILRIYSILKLPHRYWSQVVMLSWLDLGFHLEHIGQPFFKKGTMMIVKSIQKALLFLKKHH